MGVEIEKAAVLCAVLPEIGITLAQQADRLAPQHRLHAVLSKLYSIEPLGFDQMRP